VRQMSFPVSASWAEIAAVNVAPCGNITVFGVLHTGQTTLTFVSGLSAEGSLALETLKVFMQFMQSYNFSIKPRFACSFLSWSYCSDFKLELIS